MELILSYFEFLIERKLLAIQPSNDNATATGAPAKDFQRQLNFSNCKLQALNWIVRLIIPETIQFHRQLWFV